MAFHTAGSLLATARRNASRSIPGTSIRGSGVGIMNRGLRRFGFGFGFGFLRFGFFFLLQPACLS